jgi:uncharacterized membrane protein
VASTRIGYIQSINVFALMQTADASDAVVHIARGVGEFIVPGAVLAAIDSPDPLPAELAQEVESAFNIHRFRTIEQDVGFGIRQIVDVALRALSPSVNDTTTGILCVDYLSAILAHVADRHFPPREHYCAGRLRVITTEMTFERLLSDTFDQIRSNACGNLAMLVRILAALRAVGSATHDARRRLALIDYVGRMHEARDTLVSAHERAHYDETLGDTRLALVPSPQATDHRA